MRSQPFVHIDFFLVHINRFISLCFFYQLIKHTYELSLDNIISYSILMIWLVVIFSLIFSPVTFSLFISISFRGPRCHLSYMIFSFLLFILAFILDMLFLVLWTFLQIISIFSYKLAVINGIYRGIILFFVISMQLVSILTPSSFFSVISFVKSTVF